MLRAILYFACGAALNFLLMKLAMPHPPAETTYYSITFGLSLAAAYFLDSEKLELKQKALISFGLMLAVLAVGTAIYSLDSAIPAVIIFAAVFFGYYLLASLRASKSLRK